MNAFLISMKAELMVTAVVFLVLLLRLGKGLPNGLLLSITQGCLLATVAVSALGTPQEPLFGGMFVTTPLIALQKAVLALAVWLMSLLFADWLRAGEHLTEYIVLTLSSLLGMFLLLSSGHLLMFYLSLELAGIPLAAAANFDLHRKGSSEAAMKLILSSALSSGILLFGISLLYGATGTMEFGALSAAVDGGPLQTLAFVFLVSAFAFKLSVVPFHLWTADVYEGAPMPLTAFLSVVSKGAVAFVFIGVLYRVFGAMGQVWQPLTAALAVATMVTGNIFAVRQRNIKRLLAFSSIAQVGFILVAVTGHSPAAVASVTYFVLVYAFSNLAAFGVAAVLSAQTGEEDISGYRGLAKRQPFLAWMMAVGLFSLAGIPPTAGFFGKLFLIGAGAAKGAYWLIGVAAANMIVSLYYYLRVVRAMFMEEPAADAPPLGVDPMVRFGLLVCAAGVVLAGVIGMIYDHISLLAS